MASDRLNIDDLKTVRTEVLPAAFKWYDLGVELEISPNTLDTIKKAKKDDPIECLCELIAKWLRGVDPKPTWKALIAALRSTVVGYQSLAEKLESKYCESLRETGTEKDNESHQGIYHSR